MMDQNREIAEELKDIENNLEGMDMGIPDIQIAYLPC
jgi:hypothetical protein